MSDSIFFVTDISITQIFKKFVFKFSGERVNSLINNSRAIFLQNILLYCIYDRNTFYFFNNLRFILTDFVAVSTFFLLTIRYKLFLSVNLRREILLDPVSANYCFYRTCFLHVIFLFNFFVLILFLLTKRVIGRAFVDKFFIYFTRKLILFLLNRQQVSAILSTPVVKHIVDGISDRLKKRFIFIFNLKKFSFFSIFCVLKNLFFYFLPPVVDSYFKRAFNASVSYASAGFDTRLLRFFKFSHNYKNLNIYHLSDKLVETMTSFSKTFGVVNMFTFLNDYFVIRRKRFFFGRLERKFKFKRFKKFFNIAKNRKKILFNKLNILSLTSDAPRLRRKNNLFSHFIFLFQRKQFLFLFF